VWLRGSVQFLLHDPLCQLITHLDRFCLSALYRLHCSCRISLFAFQLLKFIFGPLGLLIAPLDGVWQCGPTKSFFVAMGDALQFKWSKGWSIFGTFFAQATTTLFTLKHLESKLKFLVPMIDDGSVLLSWNLNLRTPLAHHILYLPFTTPKLYETDLRLHLLVLMCGGMFVFDFCNSIFIKLRRTALL
jgi:hypothetical protein